MAENKKKVEGLSFESLRSVCWAGNDSAKWCRYVRAYKGVWICAKGTAAGIRHSERIERYKERFEEPTGEVVFDSGQKTPEDTQPKLKVHAGDNCPGRADEFTHLFEDEKQ